MTPLLEVASLSAGYDSSRVVRDVSLTVPSATVVAIMGRNGAGKTTLLRALAGIIPKQGSVVLAGEEVSNWASHRISRAGVAWVPQDNSVFPGLTVREHLIIATRGRGVSASAESAAATFPILAERLDQEAQTLSGGERKMLSIAQALASRPKLILMDEPTEGVAPVVVDELIPSIRAATEHAAVVLVEQNVDVAVATSSHCYVLENGRIVESDDTATLHANGTLERRLTL